MSSIYTDPTCNTQWNFSFYSVHLGLYESLPRHIPMQIGRVILDQMDFFVAAFWNVDQILNKFFPGPVYVGPDCIDMDSVTPCQLLLVLSVKGWSNLWSWRLSGKRKRLRFLCELIERLVRLCWRCKLLSSLNWCEPHRQWKLRGMGKLQRCFIRRSLRHAIWTLPGLWKGGITG